ncbi:hypothetical protein AS026_29655 [Rhizobium altiplani]|uniref:Uncharacterized protein n=1 Tax=Rhizobium altiplani TaxID=1864509 RepID=A0A109K136_9HYPH|nr:hypothetical protein AS026_29655 [Rhizobium altiplani]
MSRAETNKAVGTCLDLDAKAALDKRSLPGTGEDGRRLAPCQRHRALPTDWAVALRYELRLFNDTDLRARYLA